MHLEIIKEIIFDNNSKIVIFVHFRFEIGSDFYGFGNILNILKVLAVLSKKSLKQDFKLLGNFKPCQPDEQTHRYTGITSGEKKINSL